MQIKTYIIDAFSNQPFKGNPAGVCLLAEEIAPQIMQSLAGELNLSETAFLLPNGSSGNRYTIRYFTPEVEIPFCGHATVASAKLILDRLNQTEVFLTTHHQLALSAKAENGKIVLQFPLYNTTPFELSPATLQALGLTEYIEARFEKHLDMLILEVKNKATLQSVKPDFIQLKQSTNLLKELVITTKSEDKEYDFYSRCFCPWIGIDEDPVTGAAHSVLAKYWGDRLNKSSLRAFQASKRGGELLLTIKGEQELEVRADATIVLEGKIIL